MTDLDLLCTKLSEFSGGGSELILGELLDSQVFSVSS